MHQIQSKSTQFYRRRAYLEHVSSKARHLHLTASLSLSLALSSSLLFTVVPTLSPSLRTAFAPSSLPIHVPNSTISVVLNRAFATSFAPTIALLASRSRHGCDWSVWKVQGEYGRLGARGMTIDYKVFDNNHIRCAKKYFPLNIKKRGPSLYQNLIQCYIFHCFFFFIFGNYTSLKLEFFDNIIKAHLKKKVDK